MKARIQDTEALRAISPAALAAYARNEGWTRIGTFGDHADVYNGHGRPEIVLPRTDQLADYASVVGRLIGIFAETSERDELLTYRDLIGADHDVIRVRAVGAADNGSIPIDAGVELVAQARDMLLAAACATRTPQPLYRAGANREAIDYMRRVRLGQTEHGSFVVTLMAPVPPILQLPRDSGWVRFEDEPMERQVTRRLVGALEATRDAIERVHGGSDSAVFDQAVREGVSANLCEAVSRLIELAQGLQLSVSWARTRPAPEAHHRIAFSENDAGVLREAARTFRTREPRSGVRLFGWIHQLKREQHEIHGLVTLRAIVDDKLQAVRAVLDQSNYSVAIDAHEKQSPVIVSGDLERVGQRWQLTNAGVLIPSQDEDDGDDDEADGRPYPTT